MDSDGNVVVQHKGPRTVAAFGQTVDKAITILDMKAKAASGDKAAMAEVLLIELEMGTLPLSEFEEKIKDAAELDDGQKARLEKVRVNAELAEAMQAGEGKSPEQAVAAIAPKLLEMKNAGRVPTSEEEYANFWSVLLEHAYAQKDLALFEESLGALKSRFGNNPRAKGFFDQQEKRLDELKSAGK